MPAGQRRQDTPRVPIEGREAAGRGGKCEPAPAGVGNDEDHAVDTTVAHFGCQAALECLDIVEHGLGLDWATPIGATDQRVPRSAVALDRQ